MEKIGLHNYEAFLLDYFEGRLGDEALQSLRAFAVAHPELEIDLDENGLAYLEPEKLTPEGFSHLLKDDEHLAAERLLAAIDGGDKEGFSKAELDQFARTRLVPEPLRFEFREDLIKTGSDLEKDYPLVALFEGTLSENQRSGLEKQISQNPLLAIEFAAIRSTKLEAETQVVFPDRNLLMKKTRVIALFANKTTLRAAAAVTLIFALGILFFLFNPVTDVPQVAQKNNNSSQPETQTNGVAVVPGPPASAGKKETRSVKADIKTPTTEMFSEKETENLALQQEPSGGSHPELNKSETMKSAPVDSKSDNSDLLLAVNDNTENENYSDYTSLELGEDHELLIEDRGTKPGFWQKAARLARQANRLGVKSVDGVDDGKNKFRLSINSFIVEKH